MQPNPKSLLELLKEDWLEQARIVRHSFLSGVLLYILYWLDKRYGLHFFQMIRFFESISVEYIILSLLALPFITSTFQYLIFLSRMTVYKIRYPLHEMNYSYHAILFAGRGCIVDDKRKEIRWIKSSQTALDLNWAYEWTQSDLNITQSESLLMGEVVMKGGQKRALKDYRCASSIYTRGKVGE